VGINASVGKALVSGTGKLIVLLLALVSMLALVLPLSGCGAAAQTTGATSPVPQTQPVATTSPPAFEGAPLDPSALEEQYGLKLLTVRLTAVDRMVDLRLEVTDPQKANGIKDKLERAFLVHEATGGLAAGAYSERVGNLRGINLEQAGSVGYMLFPNPSQLIHRGDYVIVVAQDIPLGRIVVQ